VTRGVPQLSSPRRTRASLEGVRRLLVLVAALGAVLALALAPAAGGAPGPPCTTSVAWRTTLYKPVATHATVRTERRLGTGTLVSCRITNGDVVTARVAAPLRRPVFAVRGLRARVAVALRSRTRTTLYVSTAPMTDAERGVLRRLRGR
jgi:hypothetical protein